VPDKKMSDVYTEKLIELLDEFKEKIKNGTRDPENFLSITEIEHLWSKLNSNTKILYTNVLESALAQIDESELVNKKK